MSLHPEMCLYANYNAHIMVLPKLMFILLCSPFLSPLLHRRKYAIAPLYGFMDGLVTAVVAEVFIVLLKMFCKMLDNTENET